MRMLVPLLFRVEVAVKLFTATDFQRILVCRSYLVPTVFDSSDGCFYKLKSHLLVLMNMQCSKIGLKLFK